MTSLFFKKIRAIVRDLIQDFQWSQLFVILCLMCLSSLFIYTATWREGDGMPPEVIKQWIWFGLGLVLYLLFSMIDYHWLCKKSWFVYGGVLIMLILVLIPGIGIVKNNARSWFRLGGSILLQPAEFSKISVLVFLSSYLGRYHADNTDWRRIVGAFIWGLLPAALVQKQPDLGTAMVVVNLFFVMLFLSGAPRKLFIYLGMGFLFVVGLLAVDTYRFLNYREEITMGEETEDVPFKSIVHLKPYQFNRILAWAAPEKVDRLKDGWNREQSLIAIGSGGFQGKGWLKGDVTRGGYLPRTVSLTDFIFAVISEETGFVGGACLIGLYGMLLAGGVRIALKARELQGMLLAYGCTFLIFFHMTVNMGMALGVLPIVGVPLPLMSYGGSFVIVCMTTLGILHSVWLHRKPY